MEKVARKLRSGTMPPEGRPVRTRPRSTRSSRGSRPRWIACGEHAPNPGRVASRRLNRAEYVNAICDLLGLEVNGTELLPSDMAGFGFDNNADVLSITPGADVAVHHRGHQDQPRRRRQPRQSVRSRRSIRSASSTRKDCAHE